MRRPGVSGAQIVDLLVEARVAQGLSVREVSRRSGVHVGQLSKWERGLTMPGLYAVIAWAEALGLGFILADVDPGDLCRRCFGEVGS